MKFDITMFSCRSSVNIGLTMFGYLFRTPLMLAVENGHVDTVLYLIANSAIVNARDIHGRSALHRGVGLHNI